MSFEITILGSSAATPVKGRYMTSQYLNIENDHLLIDCGEATQFQLLNHNINIHKISRIFISHLHGDHFYGLPGLLSTMNLQSRTADLHIHGPRGLDEVLIANFKHTNTILNFRVFLYENPTEHPELIYENNSLTVETIPLNHRVPCTGFLFKEKIKPRRIIPEKLPSGLPFEMFKQLKAGIDVEFENKKLISKEVTLPPKRSRSYAFCSDTKYDENIISQIYQTNYIYHEATFMEKHKDRAERTYHTTTQQAASIASKARAEKLLIGHFSARYKDLNELLDEAKIVFPKTELALDGTKFSIQDY